ncbi:MAG: type II toxin-antitoxin system RelE/ParE family toxin [Patescibacteria group bacterium]
MAHYQVILAKNARRDLVKLDRITRGRATKVLLLLAEDPLRGVVKLRGKDETLLRARAGSYRIVFRVVSNTVEILRIAHRKDIYKR